LQSVARLSAGRGKAARGLAFFAEAWLVALPMRNPLPALALLASLLAAPALAAERLAPLPELMRGDWCHGEGSLHMNGMGEPIGKAVFYDRRDCGLGDDRLTITATGYRTAEEECHFARLRPVGDGVRGLARCTGENGATWRWRVELSLEQGTLSLIAHELR
jgi:hypothetical protein